MSVEGASRTREQVYEHVVTVGSRGIARPFDVACRDPPSKSPVYCRRLGTAFVSKRRIQVSTTGEEGMRRAAPTPRALKERLQHEPAQVPF